MADLVSSRGRSLPRKRPDDQVVAALLQDAAAGTCGICEAPLLGWWGWCPSCGTEIRWSEQADADDQKTVR